MNGSAAPPNDEHERAEQMSRNFHWLLARLDAAHAYLCPDQNGTWQQRAEQVVAAARKLKGRTT